MVTGEHESATFNPEFLQEVSGIVKMLGHPDRIRIVEFLKGGEKSVGEVQRHTGLSQPVTSQLLRQMKDRKIVSCRRDGNRMFYSVASPLILKMLNCLVESQKLMFPE